MPRAQGEITQQNERWWRTECNSQQREMERKVKPTSLRNREMSELERQRVGPICHSQGLSGKSQRHAKREGGGEQSGDKEGLNCEAKVKSLQQKTILRQLYYPHVSDEGDVLRPSACGWSLVEDLHGKSIWCPCHWKKCVRQQQQSLKKYKRKKKNKIKCYEPGIQRISQARRYRFGQSSHWLLHHLSGSHFLKSLRLILKYSSNLSTASGMI